MPLPPFEEKIKEDGTITLLLNQTFKAAGKTRGELEKEIRERYVPRLLQYMTVTVKQQDRWYYVDGEVKSPNRQIYNSRITVLKAILGRWFHRLCQEEEGEIDPRGWPSRS